MDTPFEFLRRLDEELTEVARTEGRRAASPPPWRRHPYRRAWIGAVASLLAVAAILGLIVQTSSVRQFASSEARFSKVGAAGDQAGIPIPAAEPSHQLGVSVDTPDLQSHVNKQGQGGQQHQQPADLSKIIRDGQVAVTIDDGTFGSKSAEVSHIAAVNGGSVLSASTSGGDSGSFTLRIPAANFEKAMAQLAELGTVDSSAIHGQDVTAEFVDLKAHMKIYLSRRKVLFGLMQQANTIGETITLQNQLDAVQLKIDQISGQLNFINKQVAESAIKVDLHEPGAVVAPNPSEIDNPSLGRAWDHAVQGFLNVLAAVTIGLGYLIPILVIVAIGYAIMRFVQRRRPSASDAG
jgi:hypothetical protein